MSFLNDAVLAGFWPAQAAGSDWIVTQVSLANPVRSAITPAALKIQSKLSFEL